MSALPSGLDGGICAIRPVFVAVALSAVVSGCGYLRQTNQGAPAASGFIVLGTSAQREFGFGAGDTLPEIERRLVPTPVVVAAERQAGEYRFDRRCTRYFTGQERYLALLVGGCRRGEVIEDGRGMAVYGADGREIGRATPWLTDHYTAVSPRVRERH